MNHSKLVYSICIAQAIAPSRNGMTAGEISKAVGYITKGQVLRVLNEMFEVGYVYFVDAPYGRTGKRLWRITEQFAMECAFISRSYGENN